MYWTRDRMDMNRITRMGGKCTTRGKTGKNHQNRKKYERKNKREGEGGRGSYRGWNEVRTCMKF